MDQPSPDPALLAESLRDLAWLNRYLGGTATIVHQLGRLLDGRSGGELKVLDVGAGGADILMALARWCDGRRLGLRAVALDYGQETVRIAAAQLAGFDLDGAITVVRGDARVLPFRDRAFDVAICSTFIHHLEPDDAVAALGEMARVSALGCVVSDLRRSWPGYVAAWTLARTVWRRHRYARHDGPASMRAAYTLREARALAERAGLKPSASAQPGFRWALRWERSG